MASFSASATGKYSGTATLSGLSTVSYGRTVYINVNSSQQAEWNISANATPTSYTQNFTGLSANTIYTANWAVYKNDPWSILASGSKNFTTDPEPPPPDPPDAPTLAEGGTDSTDSEITIDWNSSSGADGYKYQYKLSTSSTWSSSIDVGTSTILYQSGLTADRTYNFRIWAYNNDGDSGYLSVSVDTLGVLSTPTYDTSSSDTDSIYIKFNVDSNATSFRFRIYEGGTLVDENTGLSNPWTTFYFLDPDTSYNIIIDCYASGYVSSNASRIVSTDPLPTLSAPTFKEEWIEGTSGGLIDYTVEYEHAIANVYYYIEVSGIDTKGSASGQAFFSDSDGLSHCISYQVRARVTKTGYSNSSWSSWRSFTTPMNPSASISITSATVNEEEISLNWTSVSCATNYQIKYWETTTMSIYYDYSSSSSKTISVPYAGEWTINVRPYFSNSYSSYYGATSSNIIRNITISMQWDWLITEIAAFNKSGTLSERAVTNLTYTRWNDFVDQVEIIRNWYNDTYGTDVPSVLSAKLSSANKTLTATKFNTVRFSIGSMNATGITDRYAGDPVLGSYFITLANKLNGIE